MAKRIDSNGVPTALNAGSLNGPKEAVLNNLVTPLPPASSFGSIVADMLAGIVELAYIVIAPIERKIFASTTEMTDDVKAVVEADYGHTINMATLTPEVGQTGLALTWTAAKGASIGAEVGDLIDTLTVAQKPKRSVSSIIQAVLGHAWDGPVPTIVVDQTTGTVKLFANNGAVGQVATEGHLVAGIEVLMPADIIEVSLSGTDNDVSPTTEKLVFEGGAV